MHGPEDMLKPHMLCRRENPPGGLELMDVPEPLDPGVVYDFLFRYFLIRDPRFGSEGDIPMNRVMSQTFRNKIAHDILTVSFDVKYE
jgi:hypothetical protein